MYDKIKRRIEQRISEGPRLNIERIAPGQTYAERDTSLISTHVTSQLGRHMRDMYDDEDASEAAGRLQDAVRAFGGLRTRHQLEKHVAEQVIMDIGGPMTAFDFTVPSSSRIFGPPYDLYWAEGSGSFADIYSRINGHVVTLPTRNGFIAGGNRLLPDHQRTGTDGDHATRNI